MSCSPAGSRWSADQDVVAEALARAGYQTASSAMCRIISVPGNNFTRGFHQWDFVRGTSEDRYRSTATVDCKKLKERYGSGSAAGRPARRQSRRLRSRGDGLRHAAHLSARPCNSWRRTSTNAKPFYLYVDTFHPHESWEAPAKYYKLYRDPKYTGKTYITLPYSSLLTSAPGGGEGGAGRRRVKAHYSGLMTMMDHWFGQLLAKLKELGKDRDTLVIYLSDHGTNFGDNLEKIMGKPSGAMYPGTMNVPLLVRHPEGKAAGKHFREYVYSLGRAGHRLRRRPGRAAGRRGGTNLLALLEGGSFKKREYQTCRYCNSVWYTDEKNWYFSDIHGDNARLFDLEADKPFEQTIAKKAPERIKRAWERILEDAGGKLPIYPLKDADKVKAPFI